MGGLVHTIGGIGTDAARAYGDVELILHRVEGTNMHATSINPWEWQQQFSYSQARDVHEFDRTIYVAGQVSVDADGAPLHPGDMAAQLGQAFDNLESVLDAAGLDLTNVVRLNYYTTDVDALFGAWQIVSERLSAGEPPASTLLGVARLAYPDLLVEIEATAVA